MRRSTPAIEGVQLGLIVTPMLDMAFQLLAFFIMTYHPSALEGHVAGELAPGPAANEGRFDPFANPDLNPVDEAPRDVVVITIKAVKRGQEEGGRREGEPSRLLIQPPEEAAPKLIADVRDSWEESLKKLDVALRDLKAPRDRQLSIAADGQLRHRFVIAVFDACKKAGYQRISFVVPRKDR